MKISIQEGFFGFIARCIRINERLTVHDLLDKEFFWAKVRVYRQKSAGCTTCGGSGKLRGGYQCPACAVAPYQSYTVAMKIRLGTLGFDYSQRAVTLGVWGPNNGYYTHSQIESIWLEKPKAWDLQAALGELEIEG